MRVMNSIITKILAKLGVKRCPRYGCGKLFVRSRGTIMTRFGAVPEDEGGGTFCEYEPTCCGPDDAWEWINA